MSAFWSRILIAIAGLPLVLGVVWLGGWWLFGLAAAATVVALHEFAGMTRPLRPLMPAAYAGALLALLGAEAGGPGWALAGFLSTFALALLLRLVADVRQAATIAIGTTVLGAAWIGVGLGHILLLRDIPDARAARRLRRPARGLGRRHRRVLHRPPDRPPQADPGDLAREDVGGVLRRQRRDDPRDLLRALRRPQGLPLDLAGARARRRARARRAGGRPLRVGGQAGHEREGQRSPARRATGAFSTGSTRFLFALSGRVLAPARIRGRMTKRIALLGATGSIGRQALEVIASHPELELCAAASGSSPLDGIDAPLTQVGGDLVAAARAGRAGRRPERRRRLRRPARHALGARARRRPRAREQGEPRRGGRARARGTAGAEEGASCRSTPSTRPRSSASRAARRSTVHSLVLTASGGPFRGRIREELSDVSPEDALAHPTWNMGPKITVDSATLANKGLELIEAHFLFGLPYERIEVDRPPDLDRPRARALPRRRRARAPRLPGHARADLVRAHLPGARGDADPAARPRLGPDARVRPAGPRDVPAAAARARGRRGRRHAPVRVQRRQRGRRGRVPRGPAAVPRDRRHRRGDAGERCRATPRATSTTWSRPTRRPGRSRSERRHSPDGRRGRHPRPGLPDPAARGGPLLRVALRSGCGRGSSTSASRRRSSRPHETGSSTASARSRSAAS